MHDVEFKIHSSYQIFQHHDTKMEIVSSVQEFSGPDDYTFTSGSVVTFLVVSRAQPRVPYFEGPAAEL